jgi:hypothetical protein
VTLTRSNEEPDLTAARDDEEMYTERGAVARPRPRRRPLLTLGTVVAVGAAAGLVTLLGGAGRDAHPAGQTSPSAVSSAAPRADCAYRPGACTPEEPPSFESQASANPVAGRSAPDTAPAASLPYPADCRRRVGGCTTEEYRVGHPDTVGTLTDWYLATLGPGGAPQRSYPPDCRRRAGGCTTEEYRVQVPPAPASGP